ncbi:hypothetical protein ONZ45_g11122 [Pleurotus djamor]|nr:hypothetical protein ONZ45_g11122 [Pleurotus djamor]
MAFSYRDLFFGGKTFCCCIPVRIGVLIMSFLGMLLAGILSILLWFQVASTPDMTSGEKAAFVCAALVETLLFVACILGFSGVIVRKQAFVQIYAYFTYFHFVLNIGVAAWLFWVVSHGTENAATKACQQTIQNPGAQDQCIGLLKVAKGVYIGVALAVLLIELYGAIIVARYVNQIQGEKRTARASRVMGSTESGFALIPQQGVRYSSVPGGQHPRHQTHLSYDDSPAAREFNPYAEAGVPQTAYAHTAAESYSYGSPPPLAASEEIHYGGGQWSHEDISVEEKERLKQKDIQMGILPDPEQPKTGLSDDTVYEPPIPPVNPRATLQESVAGLTRYSLSDPPVNKAS